MQFPPKKTAALTLVLIAGGIALSACDREEATQRAVYKSQAECIRDWVEANPSPDTAQTAGELCEEVKDGTQPRGYYYGPHYMFMGGLPYYYSLATRSFVQAPARSGVYLNRGFTRSSAVGSAVFRGSTFAGSTAGRPPVAAPSVSRGGFGSSARGGFRFGAGS